MVIAGAVLLSALVLLFAWPHEQSEAYKQGYSSGYENASDPVQGYSGVDDVCDVDPEDNALSSDEERFYTPQEYSDFESGCRDGWADGE